MVSSALRRKTIQRAINTMVQYRPCRFFVDHTPLTTHHGGPQGETITYGPYRGVLAAPGSESPRQVVGIAGSMVISSRWALLALPHVKVAYGETSRDFIRVDGYPQRFKVSAVRPVSDIIPPVGLIIGLDEQA